MAAPPETAHEGSSPSQWPSKLAWLKTERSAPPKRPASERRGDFREIYATYDEEAVRDQASRCIQCPNPLCRTGCPLANRIPEWLALAAEGRFIEAAAVSQTTSNMPEICSRVCPQERLCEGACILNACAAPVAIGAVENFINEYAFAHSQCDAAVPPFNGLRVAVVGAGPGGIACADELAKCGYKVTVFEALGMPGGLLVYGIPSFKLDKAVVERRIDVLRRRGVQFCTEVRVGTDLTLGELTSRYDSVFLAIGAQKPKPLDVPGADLAGVYQAVPFLVQKNVEVDGDVPFIPVTNRRIVVLGGGDTAMDCLRTAIRSGAAEAVCLYRRDEANMPGSRKEYANAIEEGARFQFLAAPVALESDANGQVAALRCIRMELGKPDAGGRRRPKAVR
jgi:glutamate synthase (NADPH/NADH) small chain